MKYLFGLAILSVALTGCQMPSDHTKTADSKESTKSEDVKQNSAQVIHFTGPQDLTIELKTTDNFDTAEMKDNSDKVYKLKRVVSGSGIRLADQNGVAIHFKTNMDNINEGTVELVSGKFQEIKESKVK